MGEAIFEGSSVAEESVFMKLKRECEEEEEELELEKKDESDDESCKFSEYGDVENLVMELEKELDSYDDPVSEEYREYCLQTEMSEGFNVPCPPKGTLGAVYPMLECSVLWPLAQEGAEIAVEHYNDNRAPRDGKLQFVRLESATSGPAAGYVFYVTFEAKNVTSGEKRMYQSKLFRRFDGYWTVLTFRKKKHAV